MNRERAGKLLRYLMVAGIGIIVFCGFIAAGADGFGDPPPPISVSIAIKRTGVAVSGAGLIIVMKSIVALCYIENERRR